MENEIIYQLALSQVPGIGTVSARKLISHFGEARAIFRADEPALAEICGTRRAGAIVNFNEFHEMEAQQSFLEKYAMRSLFITDKDYPQRLLSCEQAPIVLFYKGNTDLNNAKVVAVVGTRTPTDYGRQAAAWFIRELASLAPSLPGLLIVSGLAYGIDAIAHQAALDNNIPTIGVLGHGLDRIYPQQNALLAKKMVYQGGLLTQFNIGAGPETHNFPLRNRIVAGISDALIVVETGSKGGSLLTVDNALDYDKKVFAFPGRINDPQSSGCNALIREGKARLLSDATQFIKEMKWEEPATGTVATQASLFPGSADRSDLSEIEKRIFYLFREKKNLSLDELAAATQLQNSALSLALLHLELQGWIDSLPGKRYRLRE